MDFEEFREKLVEDLHEALPERLKGASIEESSVQKLQKIDVYFNFLGKYVPATEEISEEERIAMIDAEHEERLKAKNQRAVAKQKEYMAQLKIDAENGDVEAIAKLAHKKEIARKASAKANAKLREARNADPEYIAMQEAKEQARILKVQEQERKRIEGANRKRKEKRSELVARAKTDPEAMEELMAIRAKEAEARAKKKTREDERMAADPEYAKAVIAKRKEYNRRHSENRKAKLADMQLTKYEQETIINYNAGELYATVYTRDKAVMRKLDTLVTEFPEVYRLVGETDIDKTYEMPKRYVNYR